MGVSSSKIEGDKVLVLCQERRRFVREALDGRCVLASAHYDYIVSLRHTGSLLRKCFEEVPADEKEGDFAESHDDFNNPSTEASVHVSKDYTDVPIGSTSAEQSSAHHASESVVSENIASANTNSQSGRPKDKRRAIGITTNQNDEIAARAPVDLIPFSAAALPMGSKEPNSDVSLVVKDLSSCMKQIEKLFFRASDSGKQVPMIIEEDKIHFRALLPEEIAHGSKASSFLAAFLACCREEVPVPEPPPQAEIKYLTWHRSLSPSRNPPGIIADIGTSTLDRLYAWETKLYDEVKASSTIGRRYDEKCKQLRDQESRGKNRINIDFTRATVKDLYSRILVAIQKINFISKNIEDLRDTELQPQLDELIGTEYVLESLENSVILIQCLITCWLLYTPFDEASICFSCSLTRMWATMLECHQHQHAIIKLVVSRSSSVKTLLESESGCQAALLLSLELRKLCSSFQSWMASHKAYLCSLNLWLQKCMKPLKKRKSARKQNAAVDVTLTECGVAPRFTTCEVWVKLLEDLPTMDLEYPIEGLIADISSHLRRHSDDPLVDQHSVSGEMRGEIPGDDMAADIQSSLVTFMEKLSAFAEISLHKYVDLQKCISAARERLLTGA